MSNYKNRSPRRQTDEENVAECSFGCGSQIRFIRSVRYDRDLNRFVVGSFIPVQPVLVWGDCFRTLVVVYPHELRGRVVPNADPDIQGYEPHFGYCSEYQKQEKIKKAHRERKAIQLELPL